MRPFQVMILPFKIDSDSLWVYVFQRKLEQFWQFVAGGGEGGENPTQAAVRELAEETSISTCTNLIELDTVSSIPINVFENCHNWDEDIFVIPEYSFAANISDAGIRLSHEHLSYRCVQPDAANQLLKFDSNKTALFELEQRFNLGKV